jgi:hypothetical protein
MILSCETSLIYFYLSVKFCNATEASMTCFMFSHSRMDIGFMKCKYLCMCLHMYVGMHVCVPLRVVQMKF